MNATERRLPWDLCQRSIDLSGRTQVPLLRQVTAAQVRTVLLRHDPILIGCPSDPYRSEVQRTLGALEIVRCEEDVAPLVRAIFVDMFDDARGRADREVSCDRNGHLARRPVGRLRSILRCAVHELREISACLPT